MEMFGFRRQAGLAGGSDVALIDRRIGPADGGAARRRILLLLLGRHAGGKALLPRLHLFLGRLGSSLRLGGYLLRIDSTFAYIQRHQKTGDHTELSCSSNRLGLQLIDDGSKQLSAFLGELAVPLQAHGLPQQTQSRHEYDFLPVDADRGAKTSLIKQLQNLDNVLARVRHSENRRRTELLVTEADSGAVNQGSDKIVDQRLLTLAVAQESRRKKKLTNSGERLLVTLVLGLSCENSRRR